MIIVLSNGKVYTERQDPIHNVYLNKLAQAAQKAGRGDLLLDIKERIPFGDNNESSLEPISTLGLIEILANME